jgi:hypothetical protein
MLLALHLRNFRYLFHSPELSFSVLRYANHICIYGSMESRRFLALLMIGRL